MSEFTSFGAWMQRRRKLLDLTRKALADLVGCSPTTINKIERDERKPSVEIAELLAVHLQIPEEEQEAFVQRARGTYLVDFDAPTAMEVAPQPVAETTNGAKIPIPHNLPAQTTTFIGRTAELTAVCKLLNRPEVRLITLTGPGGTGKTRLSLQVAADMLDFFADGVFFVDLAPLTNPALVEFAIAETLGIRPTGNRPIVERLKENLQDKQILLVLDNFEQVLLAAPTVAEILTAAPKLKVLVTSRSLLRLSGEWDYPVPPLELPNINSELNLEEMGTNEAMSLFCERAKAVSPKFALVPENAAVVAKICITLDGLPLAIELAAARTRLLPPEQILNQLSYRLRFLTGGPRDLPARQQTLRNTIDWSYELLEADDQILFQQLAVFVGGFTFDAAEALSNVASEMDIFNQMESLLDKNLLKQTEGESTLRFDMLETIREYALERLVDSGHVDQVNSAHAYYFMKLAEAGEPHMYGPEQLAWINRLDSEQDNMRTALQWSLETDVQIGLRLAAALGRFWHLQAHHSEGRHWLDRVLDTKEAGYLENRRYKAKALNRVGVLSIFLGDMIRATSAGEESVSLWREVGDKGGLADALCDLGSVIIHQGDVRGRALLEESIDLFRLIEDEKSLVRASFWHGGMFYRLGDYKQAALHLEECRLLGQKVGDISNVASAISILARIEDHQGNYEKARLLTEQSLALYTQVEDKPGIAYNLGALGVTAYFQGSNAEARRHFEACLQVWQALGNIPDVSWLLLLLGNISLDQDDHQQAAELFERSLLANATSKWKLGLVYAIAGLAAVAQAQTKLERAARLFSISDVLQKSNEVGLGFANRELYQPTIAVLRTKKEQAKQAVKATMGNDAFKEAYADGQAMLLDQALAYALER